MKQKRAGRLVAILTMTVLGLAPAMMAQTSKNYVILGNGQGPGSTAFAAKLGPAVTGNFPAIGVVTAVSSDPKFASWASALSGVQAVAEDPEVQWINNEVSTAATVTPSPAGLNTEPLSGFQWNMRQIGADQANANGNLGAGARVAVLDAGMDLLNDDLKDNINQALAISFVPGEVVQPHCCGFNHGTHVGGIVAAEINDFGVQGVAPSAELVPVKVLRESGSGAFSWVISGIMYASGSGVHADVINMSLGAFFDLAPRGTGNNKGGIGSLFSALNRAINHATQQGTLVVSAAGNDGANLNSSFVNVPAQSGNGMGVSATGPIAGQDFNRLASYSNFGNSVVNVAAPGGDFTLFPSLSPFPWFLDMVLSDSTGDNFFFAAGTSMATPHVSGEAALLVGKYGHMSPAQLKMRIQNTADPQGPQTVVLFGHGIINALAATSQ